MGYNRGEIYFVREWLETEQRFTDLVKIGLVRETEKRDSYTRLVEHQTGNPRVLHLEDSRIVKTDAVDKVETLLHNFYADRRVSGEWFLFSDDDSLKEAIDKAKSLAAESVDFAAGMREVEELDRQESNGQMREASPRALELQIELSQSYELAKQYGSLEAEIKSKYVIAYQESADLGKGAKTVVKKFSPKLDKDGLKVSHPDIFEQFLVDTKSWQHAFRPKYLKVPNESLPDRHVAQLAELRTIINSVKTSRDIAKLHEPNLLIVRERSFEDFSVEGFKMELKRECGLFDGISSVCDWKRGWKESHQFDEVSFSEAYPELCLAFMQNEETKTYIQKTRSAGNI